MANYFDRLALAVAPQYGLKRIKARTAATALMNYDAASKGRRSYGWKAPTTSGDAAGHGARSHLRALSRDMIRNRAYAHRAQDVVTGNVVGTGIRPSVTIDDQDRREKVMAVLHDHFGSRAIDSYGRDNFFGLQKQVMDAVFSDGEVLVRFRPRRRPFNPGLRLLFQIQVMEVDHLDPTVLTNGQNEVVDGVEFGPTGRVEAYHLYDQHPGDLVWRRNRRMSSTRVPADQVLHIRRSDRPGQARGVPWLAPVMMSLGELGDYQEAQILKQRMAALMAAFVEADEGGTAYAGKEIEELGPGAIIGLQPGQKVSFNEPPTVEGYGDFMKQNLRGTAVGVGITYESLAGDLEGVNFSSGRMGRMEMDRNVETWQQLIMIAQFCEGVSRWALDVWRMQRMSEGNLPEPPDGIGWTAPRRPLIDPAKEVRAAADEIEAGLTSRQRKQRELGYDPETIARERAEDAARDDAVSRGQQGELT